MTVGDVLRDAARRASNDRNQIVILLIVLVGASTLLDLYDKSPSSDIVTLFPQLYAQCGITIAALKMDVPVAISTTYKMRVGMLFLLSLASGIAILLGLILLVVPGFILMIRWYISVPIMLEQNTSINNSLGKSWDYSKEHWVTIFGVLLLCMVPFIGQALLISVISFWKGIPLTVSTIFNPASSNVRENVIVGLLNNLIVYVTLFFSWITAVSVYRLTHNAGQGVAEIIA